MGILSVQSQVVAGFVGNSVAVFALQRLGIEVWPIPTILLSHHPGHGGAQGDVVPAHIKARILEGLDHRGCFSRCDAIISGYLSGSSDAGLIREALRRARRAQTCVYLCDPVIGDDGKTYVPAEVVAAMGGLIPLADIITPNAYELSVLTGISLNSTSDALRAMHLLQARGPGIVLLTSFCGHDTPPEFIDVIIVDGLLAWRLRMPKLDYKFSGAGDLLAGIFLHFWLSSRDSNWSITAACEIVFSILRETMTSGFDELMLIQAQRFLQSPDCSFTAERLT